MKGNVQAIIMRLKSQAQARGAKVQDVYDRYFLLGFLTRLSRSRFRDQLILKGGMLLHLEVRERTRETKDIDLLAIEMAHDEEQMQAMLCEICAIEEPDGIQFLTDRIATQPIREDQLYGGTKFIIPCRLSNIQFELEIDIAFGDALVAGPVMRELHSTLPETDPIPLLCYSLVSVIAEKTQAMLHRAEGNSRMKDYYDVYLLLQRYPDAVTPELLKEAIRATFARRQAAIDPASVVFRESFAADKDMLVKWSHFLRKNIATPADFPTVMARIREVIQPIMQELYDEQQATHA